MPHSIWTTTYARNPSLGETAGAVVVRLYSLSEDFTKLVVMEPPDDDRQDFTDTLNDEIVACRKILQARSNLVSLYTPALTARVLHIRAMKNLLRIAFGWGDIDRIAAPELTIDATLRVNTADPNLFMGQSDILSMTSPVDSTMELYAVQQFLPDRVDALWDITRALIATVTVELRAARLKYHPAVANVSIETFRTTALLLAAHGVLTACAHHR